MESDDDCPPDLVPAQGLLALSSNDTLPEDTSSDVAEVVVEVERPPTAPGAVPVTIVTGFLGAGKTTLLNYILTQDHGRRIAVIENEVGDSMDIESLIAKDGADGSVLADNLFELRNGCICCAVKDDLVTTLEMLLQRRNKFDYVIIETTGLANPGPVASVFWLDEALESALRLDSIVTLVDAKNFVRQLQRVPGEGAEAGAEGEEQSGKRPKNEAAMQVAYADRVLINKSDLVSTETLDDVVGRVRTINALAEVRCTKRSAVDLAWILDTECFSSELAAALDPSLAPPRALLGTAQQNEGGRGSSAADRGIARTGSGPGDAHVHSHDVEPSGGHTESVHHHADGEACDECAAAEGPGGTACSVHDPSVTTCAVDLPGSLDLSRLERWLGGLLWDPPPGGTEVYRVKGVVSVEGRDERFVVQGVADLFEVTPAEVVGSAWQEGEARRCKVVFIGRLLSSRDLELGIRSCMVQD
ncbi:conserved unknown protein [Ectocarpus siliculosus]|uniref:CobW C-terminal domain-containing protein n=1 Tax=Ectocarpus siliculosus TaxID=2880 RepID=D7FVB8_ECTSI|nr:conserved unknown protein [Ectocarpus siliculosus]|eukprot:CBJ26290.1 conserved unknown protein [Ectocarpus siliculosus]